MPIPKADLPPDGRPLPPPPPQVRQPPYDPNTPDIPNTTWKTGQFVLANGTGLVNGDWYSCTVNGPLPNNYVNLTCIIPHGTAQAGGWTYAVQEMHVPAKQIRPRQ